MRLLFVVPASVAFFAATAVAGIRVDAGIPGGNIIVESVEGETQQCPANAFVAVRKSFGMKLILTRRW